MITSSLVDAEVRVRMITQPDPFSASFKLCFWLWEWSIMLRHSYSIRYYSGCHCCMCPKAHLFCRILFKTRPRLLNLTLKYTEKTDESKRGNEQCLPWCPIATCVTIQGRDLVNIPKSQGGFPVE
ncbi:hypothetical protein PoB_004258300 [Plakobranchus ocellatus]|uniref:Uncharacterized protein n=1 Tax=Plakobranchus ocellatus TaxID=259542 RepID=A0AAV4BB89_9GAST|nr:hypothetical protein PoB_004258300 [Plakobranchus ocellatus]